MSAASRIDLNSTKNQKKNANQSSENYEVTREAPADDPSTSTTNAAYYRHHRLTSYLRGGSLNTRRLHDDTVEEHLAALHQVSGTNQDGDAGAGTADSAALPNYNRLTR